VLEEKIRRKRIMSSQSKGKKKTDSSSLVFEGNGKNGEVDGIDEKDTKETNS
jgi:hypothetical protein